MELSIIDSEKNVKLLLADFLPILIFCLFQVNCVHVKVCKNNKRLMTSIYIPQLIFRNIHQYCNYTTWDNRR